MLTGLHPANLRLIATYWVRFSIRTGGGLMALLVILFLGLTAASFVIKPVEFAVNEGPGLGHSEESSAADMYEAARSEIGAAIVKGLTGASEEEAEYWLREKPALLSAMWLVLLVAFPFMACLVGFNQTAGEIGSRGLRYLLLRTARVNIFLGRFLGAFVFCAASTALMAGVLIIYIGVKLNIYPLGEMLWWGFQGYVALLLISLAYLAMCAWVSAMLDSAFGALALSFAMAGGSVLVLKMADMAARGVDLEWLERLLPWGWKYELLSGDAATRLTAYAVMLGFTLLFLALGLRSFNKRDL